MFAVATEPNYHKREGRYGRRVVFCITSQASWSTAGKPATSEEPARPGRDATCDMHGGFPSWERCSTCLNNHGIKTLGGYVQYPARPSFCRKTTPIHSLAVHGEEGDRRYDAQNLRCRRCHERAVCVAQNLTERKRVRLVVLK